MIASLSARLRAIHPESIQSRFRFAISFALLGLLLVASLIIMVYVFRAETAAWQGRQMDASQHAARHIHEFLADLMDSMQYAGHLTGMQTDLARFAVDEVLRSQPSLYELVVFDHRGRVLLNGYSQAPLLSNLYTTPQANWFTQAASGQTYYGDIQISKDGLPYMIIALPSDYGYVVAARLNMERLWDEITRMHLGLQGTAYLVNQNGWVIAHPDPDLPLAYRSMRARPEYDQYLASMSGAWLGFYTNLEDERVVGAASPVAGTGWAIFTEVPQQLAFANSRDAILILSLFTLLLWLLSTWAANRTINRLIFQPLRVLQAGVRRLSLGELDHRLAVTSRDELGQVSEAFNVMSQRLQGRERQLTDQAEALSSEIAERNKAESALHKLNDELEQRVQARTAELSRANELLQQEAHERERVEAWLRESEERYSLAAQGANDGLWDWDLRDNRVYYSPRWKAMLGFEDGDIGDRLGEWLDRIHPEDLDRFRLDLHAHLGGVSRQFELEYRILHRDGAYRWMLTRGLGVRNRKGKVYRIAGSQTDITTRKQAEERLVFDALHDALTGLPNRSLFLDRLQHASEVANRREFFRYSVLFLDFDNFKFVNDSLGHMLGDQLLIAVAARMKGLLRSSDTLARLGGDEFVLLLEDLQADDEAITVAERLQSCLQQPFDLNGQQVFMSASIGIVHSDMGYDRSEEMLRDADIAMYRAKTLGKAQFALFDTSMRQEVLSRLELENDLRRAMDACQLQIYYQPIISLATGELMGFEALLRWLHPQRGFISPLEFIPIAEECGLITSLGRWTLRQACLQMRTWQDQQPCLRSRTISVNLSTVQFSQADLIQQVAELLQETGLDPRCLSLEITESVLMSNPEKVHDMLVQLRSLGVKISIDDFGTGYSALGYLQQFPVDAIKIDRSFISKLSWVGDNSEIIKAIITLCRGLGLGVIAEGIENEAQLGLLRSLNCQFGQGYLFARPLTVPEIEAGYLTPDARSPLYDFASQEIKPASL